MIAVALLALAWVVLAAVLVAVLAAPDGLEVRAGDDSEPSPQPPARARGPPASRGVGRPRPDGSTVRPRPQSHPPTTPSGQADPRRPPARGFVAPERR